LLWQSEHGEDPPFDVPKLSGIYLLTKELPRKRGSALHQLAAEGCSESLFTGEA
jgi:hypothetical protein